MTEKLIAVTDALLLVLEPGTPTTTRDSTASEPFIFVPDTLYLWPNGPDEHRQSGTGRQDEERFQLAGAYALADDGERRNKLRTRVISVALDDKAHLYAERIRANRHQAPAWDDLAIAINHDGLRTVGSQQTKPAVRGFTFVIRGWRIVGP